MPRTPNPVAARRAAPESPITQGTMCPKPGVRTPCSAGFREGGAAQDDPVASTRFVLRRTQAGEGRGRHSRAQARGKDECAGPVPQPGHQGGAACDEGSSRPEGLPERAHEGIRDDTGLGAKPTPVRTKHAQGMGFVDKESGAVPVAARTQGAQVGAVGVHAEVGLGEDAGIRAAAVSARGSDRAEVCAA
jgi:hypothetical protein